MKVCWINIITTYVIKNHHEEEEGKAYYIAARTQGDFNEKFYSKLIEKLNITPVIETSLPKGVTAQLRTDGKNDFVFLMNFNNHEEKIILEQGIYEYFYPK